MPRKPRIEYAGAVYHVMNRGDRGGRVFLDKLDYDLFLAKLTEVCGRTGRRIHSYVLMPNHFHWLAVLRKGFEPEVQRLEPIASADRIALVLPGMLLTTLATE